MFTADGVQINTATVDINIEVSQPYDLCSHSWAYIQRTLLRPAIEIFAYLCFSLDNKKLVIHNIEYYSSLKKIEFARKWKDLECIILGEAT